MALMSMALVSGTERDAIFLEKLNDEENVDDWSREDEHTEIHRMIELEQDRENSRHIARFLYHHQFSPPSDFRRNDYPIDIVHGESSDKLVSHSYLEFQSNTSRSGD